MLKNWTVRTYLILERYHYDVNTPEEAVEVARLCVDGYIRNCGLGMATELLRAAGCGVYTIHSELKGRKSVDWIKMRCEHLDIFFHSV